MKEIVVLPVGQHLLEAFVPRQADVAGNTEVELLCLVDLPTFFEEEMEDQAGPAVEEGDLLMSTKGVII